MTIPFLNFFKRKTKEPTRVAPPKPSLIAEKRSGERLSKTVLPSAFRAASAHDPFHLGPSSSPSGAKNGALATGPRPISLGATASAPRRPDLPPALALALEPKVERVISLELGDIVPQMPPGLVKVLNEDDAGRRVLLKAAELEKGMASGKPSVSIATIYRQVPTLFLRPVEASDTAQVELPFAKVLEQFTNLQLRSDQYHEQSVPQVETPFLKVTLEDNERFGTTIEALETNDLPPVRVQPATADTIAAAEPEPAAHEKVPPVVALSPIQFPAQTEEKKNGAPGSHVSSPEPKLAPSPEPKLAPRPRIPFKLSPIGTDAPASENVPASNGASVPTSLPPPAEPRRIPFKVTAPSEDARPKEEPWLTKESFGMAEKTPPAAERPSFPEAETLMEKKSGGLKISLPLKPILNALPPFQLTGDISGVPEDQRLELPFALVEPQLTFGRVSINPGDFAAALPEEYRPLFSARDIAAPVALPLQEVLKNLPVASLRMRDDQEEQERGADFATPFSARAAEDAKRFNVSGAPVAKPLVAPLVPAPELTGPVVFRAGDLQATKLDVALPRSAPLPVVLDPPRRAPEVRKRTGLQELFDTEEDVDAKEVVARVSKMEGVKACAITFSDGLNLAGNFPEELQGDGICALVPSMLQRMVNHLVGTRFGELGAMTLSCANASITFVMKDDLCLAALHSGGELMPETRERLARIVQELSEKYSHPV